MAGEKKIYFVSDVHLGAPALNDNSQREHLFVKWLDSIKADAGKLFLMGDIFDYWFEYKKVAPRGFTRTLGKIAELSDSGIEVHFFTGNHDVWVFDYLPSELGMELHRGEFKTEILGKKFYLAHGDGFDPHDKGYNMLKKMFTSKTLQWFYARLHPDFTIWFAHRWSKNSRLSKGVAGEAFKASGEALFLHSEKILENEMFDFFIYGHRHLLADIPLAGRARFILLGDWITLFSFGVFDGEKFELKRFLTK